MHLLIYTFFTSLLKAIENRTKKYAYLVNGTADLMDSLSFYLKLLSKPYEVLWAIIRAGDPVLAI
jgi:hypothetical protein